MIRRRGPRQVAWTASLLVGFGVALAAPAAAQEPVRMLGDSVYFDFEAVPLAEAFESISDVVGLNYVLSGDVAGTITMRTGEGIPIEEVPAVLETLLAAHDLVLVRSGELFVVTRRPSAATTGYAAIGGVARDIFVIFLKNADAVEMANLLVVLFGGETDRFQRRADLAGRGLSEQLQRLQMAPIQPGLLVPVEPRRTEEAGRESRPVTPGELIGETTIVPDQRTNALVVRTAPENFEAIRATVERLDVRPLQVLIEVVIAEVALDERTQFGINFARFFQEDGVDVRIQNVNPGNLPPDTLGFVISVFDPDEVRAVLQALASDNRLNVLSTPRILASNNQEARILIGSEVPFVQISSFGGVANTVLQSIQFRDVGLELTVIPRINQDREVTLDILQQNSSVTTATFGGLDAPLITSREAQTTLVVGDRRTVVLGGLIEAQQEVRESGIPFLKDIPILGYLFKSVDRSVGKSELIITLTPYIVGSDEEAEALRHRIEEEWDRFREDPGKYEPDVRRPRIDAEIELTPPEDDDGP